LNSQLSEAVNRNHREENQGNCKVGDEEKATELVSV